MRPPIRTVISALLPALFSVAADAAEWKIDPTISFRAGYNDNLRMTINDKVSTAEASFRPGAVFSRETAESGISGELRFNFRRFEEDSNLNDNNAWFETRAFRRMERSTIGLNASLVKDTTLDSQLKETGFVFDRIRRLRINAGPNWTYNLSERSSVSVGYNYSDVQYQNTTNTLFVDYTLHSGQISLQRILNESAAASLTTSFSRSENENRTKSKNANLQAGVSYRFSETLSGSLFAGARYTETDFRRGSFDYVLSGDQIVGIIQRADNVSNSTNGYTFSGSLSKRFLRGETSVSASRNISNSINGVPVEVTRLGWNSRYRLTELLSVGLNLQLYNSEADNKEGNSLNRNYYQIEPRFDWNFKKLWRFSGSYRYRRQTFDDTDDDAVQNAAYLTLTYLWPRIALSR